MREWDFRTQTHNNKRVLGGKTWNGFVIVRKTPKNFTGRFSCYFWNAIAFQRNKKFGQVWTKMQGNTK